MKRILFVIVILITTFTICACSTAPPPTKGEKIAEESVEIAKDYKELLDNPEPCHQIINHLADAGYAVIDTDNQFDMVNAEQTEAFIQHVSKKESATLQLFTVTSVGGFIRYDFTTEKGKVDIIRTCLAWEEQTPKVLQQEEYAAVSWSSSGGYLFFEREQLPGTEGLSGYAAIRVQPLNKKCRELNQTYLYHIGYNRNNMFITDWSEPEFENINFYDAFDMLYTRKTGEYLPYETTVDGATYEVPQKELEDVLTTFFKVNPTVLQKKTVYHSQSKSYQYRPRGLYDRSAMTEIPYPEVVDYRTNQDGTLTLTVNAVWPEKALPRAFSHDLTIRPLEDGTYQYVSNQMDLSSENADYAWYTDRLSEEEWKINYDK